MVMWNNYTVSQQRCWGNLLIPSMLYILSFMSYEHESKRGLLITEIMTMSQKGQPAILPYS